MRMLITGATGFVGAHLVRHFAGQGHAITASARGEAPAGLLSQAGFLRADLSHSIPAWPTAQAIVHAAALASDTAPDGLLERTNVMGTRHVFEATRDCRVFIYISSGSVYPGGLGLHKENETAAEGLLSPYGRSKRRAEDWLLQQDWSERTLIILRPRAIYGPGDRVLLPRLLHLVRGGRICIPGDMRIASSLTHVSNLCGAVQSCLTFAEQHPGGAHVFNVADAMPYEMREVVRRLLSAIHGRELPFLEMPLAPLWRLAGLLQALGIPSRLTQFGLAAVSESCVLDLTKIRQMVGYQPKENLWEAVVPIAEWVRRVGLARVRSGAADLPWEGFS